MYWLRLVRFLTKYKIFAQTLNPENLDNFSASMLCNLSDSGLLEVGSSRRQK